MATQQAGTPAKKRRMGIFPDSVRKIVIVFMLVLLVIAGIIGIIGIVRGWDIVFNVLFMIFAVAGVILAILTFWPSNNQNEASAPVSHKSSRRFKWKSEITWGQEDITETTSESQLIKVNKNQPSEQSAVTSSSAIDAQQPPSNILVNSAPEQARIGEIAQINKNKPLEKLAPLTQPNDLIQAPPLQEDQLAFNPPNPQQALPQNMSSHELMSLAQGHIQIAQHLIVEAAHPFSGKGSLFSRHYHDAMQRLKLSIDHVHYLLELLPMILACPIEQTSSTLYTMHEEIKVEIYWTIDEAERLVFLLQKENEKDRQNIVQKTGALEKLLHEILLVFGG